MTTPRKEYTSPYTGHGSVYSQRSQKVPPSRGRPPPPSRRSSKAQYQPLISNQGRWSSVRRYLQGAQAFQNRGRLGTVTETESEYYAAPSVAPTRQAYEPSSSAAINANISAVTHYLEQTGVEQNFLELLSTLLSLSDLPYNPYPGFVRRIRILAEKFHVSHISDQDVLKIMYSDVVASSQAYIYQPVDCSYSWGLRSVVEMVESRAVKQYHWLIESLTSHRQRLPSPHKYSNQVMLALVGPCAFSGTVYSDPCSLAVRMEFLITGPNAATAVDLFINSVLNDIVFTETDKTHVLLGVIIPRQSTVNPDEWTDQYWPYERIVTKKESLKILLTDAITANRYIISECVFCMDGQATRYQRGQIQYALNFIQVTDTGDSQGVSYFTGFPLVTLHEGIFWKQSHAEAYLSTFTPRPDLVSKISDEKADSSKKKKKKKTVRVDGFREELSENSPEAAQITAPIKASWQRKIASLNQQTELFDLLHFILLVGLIDRKSHEEALFTELYKLQHSTAARLYNLMQLNRSLREIMMKFQGEEDCDLVRRLFVQYKQGISELFDHNLQERSSDLVTCGKAVNRLLEDIPIDDVTTEADTVPQTIKNIELLKSLNSYTFTLLLGLIDDVLAPCFVVKDIIETSKVAFPDYVIRPRTATRNRHNKKKTGARAGEGEERYKHGVENDSILKHDRQVVNVEMCIQRDSAPKAIAVEAVLLRYVTDTHLENIWPHYLLDLVTSGCLPPNPYSQLVTVCRQAAMSMDLCYESKDQLVSRLVHTSARVEDPANYVHHIPGCNAHGLPTAMSLLNTGTFFDMAPLVAQFIQTDFTQKKPPFRVAICCAVSGFTPLYGRLDPYLKSIELHEHCYVRGPDGCVSQATEVYSKIVYTHLKELYEEKSHPIIGLFMGREEVRWSVEEILSKKKSYATEFERYSINKEPIYVKIYARHGWRLVPIIKHFKLHFINDSETQHETMCPHNPGHLYLNVFLDKERAAFHFQFGGPPDRSNPYNVSNVWRACQAVDQEIIWAKEHQDWLTVYRWLLLKNLISQGKSLVPEVWRMLHSVAGRLEYTISLARSLQDLLRYALDVKETDDTATYYNMLPEDGDDDTAFKLETFMSRMVMAFRQMVIEVCTAQCVMAPVSLRDVLLAKIQSITERDEVSREIFILVQIKSVYILEELVHSLKALQDAVAYDVHCISPESQAVLRSVEVEALSRPASVASCHLDNPDLYRQRPAAKYPDFVNDWSGI